MPGGNEVLGPMLVPSQRIDEYEKKVLAPYAAFSAQSRGRRFPQGEHPLRSPYQRDRDRVIHSAAFRRLEYKTQVFVNHEGDHYRTRLTHTIEVAQISRTVARALGLNEDLAEAIALVHDLGHTPFGHSGEEILNGLMQPFGGFNHNRQSLRVVDFLERRYPEHHGLNLTYEVREGIVKHEAGVAPIAPEEFPIEERPTLEAALVDLADAIAYNSHDADDGLSSGILQWDELADVPLWCQAAAEAERSHPGLDHKLRRHSAVRLLVDWQVRDLIEQSSRNIAEHNIAGLADVRNSRKVLIEHSPDMTDRISALSFFLKEKMYRHPKIAQMAREAKIILESLFSFYQNNPLKLHGKFKLRLGAEPVELIIADFIAGMTDRYAVRIHATIK